MKNIDIFIKSYARDFNLLKYALMSIEKNVTGYNNLILLIPEQDKELFETRFLPERTLVYYVKEYGNNYLLQQVFKLQAFKYSYADFIMFSDSDCIFDHVINIQDFIEDGKPEILYTSWDKVGDAKCWKEPTERILGDVAHAETMRRNQLIYHRSTLVNIDNWKPDLEKIIMESGSFSEFNLLGSYCYKYERDLYNFINTDNWTYVEPRAKQLWSLADKNGSQVHQTEYARSIDTINKVLGLNIIEI